MITNNPNTSHHQKTKSSSLKVKNQIRPSTSPSPSPAPSSVASSISSTQTLHQLPLPLPLPPSLSLPTTNTNTTITTTPIHHHNLKVTFETINFDFTSILKLISKSSSHQSRPKFNQLIQFLSTLSLPTHQPQSQSTAQQQQQITISPSPSKPSIQLTKPLDHLVILIDSIQPHLKSNIDRSLIHAIGDLIYSLHIIYHSNLSPSNIHLVNLWAQIHHHSQHIIQLTEEINLLQPKMLHPYQQIPNRPTTFDEKYQGDLENILSAIDRLYTHSPQLSNQRAQRKLPSKDLLSLDLVISSIERTTARRLDTQRASLPTLVSQGVAAMGWCVDSTLEKQGPAELELLDRLERAGSRRYTNQCSRIPPIDEQPSLMTLYTQSMRETDAMETILTKTGEGRMSNQDALLRKNRLSTPISLATSTLSRSAVEPDTATIDYDDMTSDQIGLLIGSQFPSPPSRDTHRSQSMPNIFKKNRTHSSPPQKRGLFGKKSSNPPNPTTFNSRDSQEDPFRMPSLLDYPLTNLLDDITNQDLPHGSNDVPSPDVQQEDLMIENPDQVRWATEVALRVGTTNVWLWRHDGRIILDETIEYRLIEPDLIEFTVREVDLPVEVFKVLLPVKIKDVKERKEGLIVCWNEVEELNKESEVERVKEEFYGVQDWNRNKPNRIDCRRCGNGLKEDLQKIEKYLGLPSEGWEDFVEYWICHETDDHGGYFDGKKKKGDWKRDVRENEGFVGDKFVEMQEVLGAAEVGWKVKEQRQKKDVNEIDDWKTIECKNCQENVGTMNMKTKTIKFTKFSIEPKPWKEGFDWSSILRDELLRLKELNGCNRFLIKSNDDHSISFGIWVFNPVVLISNYLMNDGLGSKEKEEEKGEGEEKGLKVMKVFYQVEQDFQPDQWSQDEEIGLPTWAILIVLDRIREWDRFEGLDEVYKVFGRFRIGYL